MSEVHDVLPRTANLIDEGIRQHLHPGAQVYVSRRGAVVVDGAMGEARAGVPMTPGTLNLWLSSSKPIAAVAIAQLWERDLLGLDDPVARFIPEFAQGGKDAITLRQILTHTAGFRGPLNNFAGGTWDQIIDRISRMRLEPRWVPGRKGGYHVATSWFILGEIVRRIDGRSFDRFVREEIFVPLGMTDSWIGMPPGQFESYGQRIGFMHLMEQGHADANFAGNSPDADAIPRPGANGRGPIRELGRFYESMLNGGLLPPVPPGEGGGEGDVDRRAPLDESQHTLTPTLSRRERGKRLLRVQTIEAMTARHRVGLFDQTFQHVIDWGLGFLINSAIYGVETVPYGYGRHASRRTFGHSGSQSSTGFADPEHGLVVALVFNGMPGERKHNQRIREVTSAIYEDLGLADGNGGEE